MKEEWPFSVKTVQRSETLWRSVFFFWGGGGFHDFIYWKSFELRLPFFHLVLLDLVLRANLFLAKCVERKTKCNPGEQCFKGACVCIPGYRRGPGPNGRCKGMGNVFFWYLIIWWGQRMSRFISNFGHVHILRQRSFNSYGTQSGVVLGCGGPWPLVGLGPPLCWLGTPPPLWYLSFIGDIQDGNISKYLCKLTDFCIYKLGQEMLSKEKQ